MAEIVPAEISENGDVRLLRPVRLASPRRAVVTILDPAAKLALDDVLDHEYFASLEECAVEEIPIDQVHAAMAKIPGNMTDDFSAEREERF